MIRRPAKINIYMLKRWGSQSVTINPFPNPILICWPGDVPSLISCFPHCWWGIGGNTKQGYRMNGVVETPYWGASRTRNALEPLDHHPQKCQNGAHSHPAGLARIVWHSWSQANSLRLIWRIASQSLANVYTKFGIWEKGTFLTWSAVQG